MSESGLYPVQSWLWSELDELGIDGVIYSRHILDLLISSKHTVDYQLAEKEQNIFSRLAPGGKKKKQKYSRRSSSFSEYEEILWKKEIAVACLLSAVDSKTDTGKTASTIQQVVDELYLKLAGLHLTSDAKKAHSDDDCMPVNVINNVTVRKKENYEDAFPSLDGGTVSLVATDHSNSIWHRSSREYEPKSDCDSDNPPHSPPSHSSSNLEPKSPPNKEHETPRNSNKNKIKRRINPGLSKSHSDNDSSLQDKQRHTKRSQRPPISCPPLTKSSGGREGRFLKRLKPRCRSQVEYLDMAGTGQQKRSSRLKAGVGHIPAFRQRKGHMCESYKTRNETSRRHRSNRSAPPNYFDQREKKHIGPSEKVIPANLSRDTLGKAMKYSKGHEKANHLRTEENMQEYAHLPSWMETTLTDISFPCMWLSTSCNMDNMDSSDGLLEEPDTNQDMAFSSRWFRDPESGLLTFKPSKTAKDLSASSSDTTNSSTCESETEEDMHPELCKKNENLATTASESWMWCPSPSLWEDGKSSPVSRLQSVYKKELLILDNAEECVDGISGKIWEEYKTIFLDLQDMDEASDQNEEEALPVLENKDSLDFCTDKKEYTVQEPEASTSQSSGKIEQGWPLQQTALTSLPTRLKVASCDDLCSNDEMFDPLFREVPMSSSTSLSNDVWKFSSPCDGWSAGDDSRHRPNDMRKPSDDMLSSLKVDVQPCEDQIWKRESLSPYVGPESIKQHEVWGGGDMPNVAKMDPFDDQEEDHVMNILVDAMFSDMSYGTAFGEEQGYPSMFPHKRNVSSPWTTSCLWKNEDHNARHGIFNVDFDYHFSVDVRSLFLHSPIENFCSRTDHDLWQPKWDLKELLPGHRQITSVPDLDSLLASIDGTDQADWRQKNQRWLLDCGPGRAEAHKKPLLDTITENDAWKTSLRIGNIWQNIAGIRPVNVIYSENMPAPDAQLIPSSDTHFRPITVTPGNESTDISANTSFSNQPDYQGHSACSPYDSNSEKQTAETQCAQCDEEKNLNGKHPCFNLAEEPSFQMNFSKFVQDKSMQTAFGIQVEHGISTCSEFFPRVPKANSR